MSNEELFKLPKDKKVKIIIKDKEYEISTHFSLNDGRKYIEELSKENDYKKAISVVVYDKLRINNYIECLRLEDIIEENDSNFTDYITSIIISDEELKNVFEGLNNEILITKRFGIAYKIYMDRMLKRMQDKLDPVVKIYNQVGKNIQTNCLSRIQEIINRLNPTYINAVSNITRSVQQMGKILQPFKQLTISLIETISNMNIPSVSKEKIEKWELSYRKWGEIGWSVLPNAPFYFFNEFPDDINTAHKLAMKYCNKKDMDELFNSLLEQNIKKNDLESAIFCYKNRQYKACALMIFCLIDSKMIKIQPKNKNRVVGLRAVNKIKSQFEQKRDEEYFLMTALYQINILTCYK